jgi:hypothetical protein
MILTPAKKSGQQNKKLLVGKHGRMLDFSLRLLSAADPPDLT